MQKRSLDQQPPLESASVLFEALASRMSRNKSYSLRAFARDLGLSPGFLSHLMSGKKRLSRERALRVSSALGLSDQQADRLMGAVSSSGASKASTPSVPLALEQFRAFSRWYHLAILDLTTCKNFRSDASWIAKRLKISTAQSRDAVARLLRLGLLKDAGGAWLKTDRSLTLPTKRAEPEVREFHRQMIIKAMEALDDPSRAAFLRRDVRGITLAVNPRKIPEAKLRIARFHQELADLLTSGDCTEVFQFNSQLFALSHETEKEN